jgi:DNA-directed RNA polymerase subunit RPC12/RpoP
MAIEFDCSRCSRPYRLRDDFAGRVLNCKKCGAKMKVPSDEEEEYYEDDEYEDDEEDYDPQPRRRGPNSRSRSNSGRSRESRNSPSQPDTSGQKAGGAVVMFVGLGLTMGALLLAFVQANTFIAAIGGGIGSVIMVTGQQMIRGQRNK